VLAYRFEGNANDSAGANHGTVLGAVLVPDRTGAPDNAYSFDALAEDVIMLDTPFGDAGDDFSIVVWLKPVLMNNGDWHGFLGHHVDTRSPSLFVNAGTCDVGFCDCSGNQGGVLSWSGGNGSHGWVIQPAGGSLPDGECDPDPEITHVCRSANCCTCATANTGNSGDGIAGNGMQWDTRTTQQYNGNQHGGQRFAGAVDVYFEVDQYTHVVWTKAGQLCKMYKNGQLTDTMTCPTHVDLHSTYSIGRVGRIGRIFAFGGVIDEVSFYSYALTIDDMDRVYLPNGNPGCDYDNPYPNGFFCNFENTDSSHCEMCISCPDCANCGLPAAGVDSCSTVCSTGNVSCHNFAQIAGQLATSPKLKSILQC
jgi:hypothetical protein